MKQLRLLGYALIVLSLISFCASAQTPQWVTASYDAVKDWSSQSNPNGVWSYGYLSNWGAPFTLYTSGGWCNVPGTSAWWYAYCTVPLVAHNDTGKTLCGTTYCVPPQYLAFHPGQNGELSVVRFTAPASAMYSMRVKFQGQDFGFPTSTYVYVLLKSKKLLLAAPITSYELPVSFNSEVFKLSAGDTVDFMVDWGADGNYNGDSTGVQAKISKLGPP